MASAVQSLRSAGDEPAKGHLMELILMIATALVAGTLGIALARNWNRPLPVKVTSRKDRHRG
jgi:hypothetical protein